LAIFPACEAFGGAQPESSIAPGHSVANIIAGQTLARRRLPVDSADAIEAKQAGLRSKPQVAVGSLNNLVDRASGKALTNLPGRVRVLADVERGIKRQSATA